MQRNWYIICTGRHLEKKAAESLTKKGIENYCPFTNKEKSVSASKKIVMQLPLFKSYVFVYINEEEIAEVKKIPYVINTVYWKSTPAIIPLEEITAIRKMESNYKSIQLDKAAVIMHGEIDILEENERSQENNILTIRHQGMMITLPSLGYTMTAQRENLHDKQLLTEPSRRSSFFKKLNPLFFFGF